MDLSSILEGYDHKNLTVGVLGGHSALDVAHGAKQFGFQTVCVARKGREKTYDRYFRTQKGTGKMENGKWKIENTKGCIDEVIPVDNFQDVLDENIQEKLRKMNTIFVHNRYFWVYFDDFSKVENELMVPIVGARTLLKLEERDQKFNQYDLLRKAGIRIPKIFKNPRGIDRPVLVKAAENQRGYERAFFTVGSYADWQRKGQYLEESGRVSNDWKDSAIEELIIGAPVNFNFFYSPLTGELELLGTDTRRQTNLDGVLRLTASEQQEIFGEKDWHQEVKRIETGHIACTVKESILEKAFDLGEKFVKATQNLGKKLDPSGKGIIGPFALQGAVVAEDGKEDIVIFDVSLRIPGSPGIAATPYSGYLYGESMSVGERLGMEIRNAVEQGRLGEIVT